MSQLHFFYKKPVYKQPVLRPLKNVATFEAQKSPTACIVYCIDYAFFHCFLVKFTKFHGIFSNFGRKKRKKFKVSVTLWTGKKKSDYLTKKTRFFARKLSYHEYHISECIWSEENSVSMETWPLASS